MKNTGRVRIKSNVWIHLHKSWHSFLHFFRHYLRSPSWIHVQPQTFKSLVSSTDSSGHPSWQFPRHCQHHSCMRHRSPRRGAGTCRFWRSSFQRSSHQQTEMFGAKKRWKWLNQIPMVQILVGALRNQISTHILTSTTTKLATSKVLWDSNLT